uniref:Cytochrome c oxidase assembly protein COX11, mitochondrial n=1 Tax=Globodera pallida TaxID=36090 RepID=A0A183C287_GLOPA
MQDVPSSMQWKFKPVQNEIYVHPGDTALAFFTAENPTDKPIIGISTYNVTPFEAAYYFNKIQCFCFDEQILMPHEQVDLPVFFYIDPDFANDPALEYMDDLMLSYTFFESKSDLKLPSPFDPSNRPMMVNNDNNQQQQKSPQQQQQQLVSEGESLALLDCLHEFNPYEDADNIQQKLFHSKFYKELKKDFFNFKINAHLELHKTTNVFVKLGSNWSYFQADFEYENVIASEFRMEFPIKLKELGQINTNIRQFIYQSCGKHLWNLVDKMDELTNCSYRLDFAEFGRSFGTNRSFMLLVVNVLECEELANGADKWICPYNDHIFEQIRDCEIGLSEAMGDEIHKNRDSLLAKAGVKRKNISRLN